MRSEWSSPRRFLARLIYYTLLATGMLLVVALIIIPLVHAIVSYFLGPGFSLLFLVFLWRFLRKRGR